MRARQHPAAEIGIIGHCRVGELLADHDRRRVGVARYHSRHHRGVDDPQPLEPVNPKFAHTLSGTIADERRHVGFGENRIGSLIKEFPERKADVERMQKEMSYYMLATFADAFRNNRAAAEIEQLGMNRAHADYHGADLAGMAPEEMEQLLADVVLKEFKTRLGRIGIAYQTPVRP